MVTAASAISIISCAMPAISEPNTRQTGKTGAKFSGATPALVCSTATIRAPADFAAATAMREPIVSMEGRTFAQALAAQATVEAFCNLSAAIKYFNQEYLLTAALV